MMKNKKKRLKRWIATALIALQIGGGVVVSPVIEAQTMYPPRLSQGGYQRGILNNFRVDAVDPEWVDGDFINVLLSYYPNSMLQGYGDAIKYYADMYGVNVVAYLGQIAKESTFGSVACGGQYNFGCFMWAPWMGVGKVGPSTGHTQFDRDWANPPTVERGIEIQMQLVRDNYINRGYVYYPVYLERYSPAYENDHSSFEALMYSVAMSFGQELQTTQTKVPGGMANNEVINTLEFNVTQYQEITNEQLTQTAKLQSDRVDFVEMLEYIDTQTPGQVETRVFVQFKDNSYRDVPTIVNIEPIAEQAYITNAQTGEMKAVEATYGEPVTVDISDWQLSEDDTIGVMPDHSPEYLEYLNAQVSKNTYTVKPELKVDVAVEGDEVSITIPEFTGQNYVLVKEQHVDPETKVQEAVDAWLDNVNS